MASSNSNSTNNNPSFYSNSNGGSRGGIKTDGSENEGGLANVSAPPSIDSFLRDTTTSMLNLSSYKLTIVPPEIANLSNLQRLNLSTNFLTTLPNELALLPKLRYLNLRANNFKDFPPVLLNMPTLEILDLSRNRIRKWPMNPGTLLRIRVLSVARNKLEDLPSYLVAMNDLEVLKVEHNPILWPPSEILFCPSESEQGAWLQRLKEFVKTQDRPPVPGSFSSTSLLSLASSSSSTSSSAASSLSNSPAPSPATPAVNPPPTSLNSDTESLSKPRLPQRPSITTASSAPSVPSSTVASPLPHPPPPRTGILKESKAPQPKTALTCVELVDNHLRKTSEVVTTYTPMTVDVPIQATTTSNATVNIDLEAFQLFQSLLFTLSHSYNFIRETSKFSLPLFKSLKPLLDTTNSRLTDIISNLPTKTTANVPISIITDGKPAGPHLIQMDPTLLRTHLTSVIHDIRKLLLTLQHNATKHLSTIDIRLLRYYLNEWQAVLIEIVYAVEKVQKRVDMFGNFKLSEGSLMKESGNTSTDNDNHGPLLLSLLVIWQTIPPRLQPFISDLKSLIMSAPSIPDFTLDLEQQMTSVSNFVTSLYPRVAQQLDTSINPSAVDIPSDLSQDVTMFIKTILSFAAGLKRGLTSLEQLPDSEVSTRLAGVMGKYEDLLQDLSDVVGGVKNVLNGII